MAHYAIGDVQGCLHALQRLLAHCRFDPAADRLILTGDLVARGPDSLGTLRYVRDLGEAAVSVLGNHDLHLLGLAAGARAKSKDSDLKVVLDAPDAAELLDYLARCPMAWHSERLDTLVIHAGLAPQWSIAEALACAGEIESCLRDPEQRPDFMAAMYGDQPDRWQPGLDGNERRRFIVNCLTRARYCTTDGRFEFRSKGAPGGQPAGLLPWFAAPARASRDGGIVFGHWSTLGTVHWPKWNVWGLDTGCVWGRELTALRLEDRRLFSVPAEPRVA